MRTLQQIQREERCGFFKASKIQDAERVSYSAPLACSVPLLPLGDALATFEGALNDLQCVLFRDGVGESFKDLLCKVDDELLRFKEQNV